MRTVILLILLSFFLYSKASAQDGTIDLSFNHADSGHFRGDGANSGVEAVLLLPDGKILIGGRFSTYNGSKQSNIVRLNANGTLDTSFNFGGVGFYGSTVRSLALQSDGKILVAGNFSRYNNIQCSDVLRLNADGTLDVGFNVTALMTSAGLHSVALQADGKILIGGTQYSIAGIESKGISRLNPDGSMDNSFTGAATTGAVHAIAVQSTGKILIGGSFEQYNGFTKKYLARLNADGTLDNSFLDGTGPNGTVATIVLRADDGFYVGGAFLSYNSSLRSKVAKLMADGAIDAAFIPGNTLSTVFAIALTPDDKILVGGLGNGIYRLNANGSRDVSFNPDAAIGGYIQYSGGILGAQYNMAHAIAVQSDGKYIIGGEFTQFGDTVANQIVRITNDGIRDVTFNRGSGVNGVVNTALVQGDGKVIIAGTFTAFNEKTVNGITRLLPDGTTDLTFNVNGTGMKSGASMGRIYTSSLQTDGKILIGGNMYRYNAHDISSIARLLPNGYLDNSFNPGGAGTTGEVLSIVVQPDGKIIIGGSFRFYNNVPAVFITRLNPDGTLDPSFSSPFGGSNSYSVDNIAIQTDGKMIVTGNFEVQVPELRRSIVRLLSNGTIDPTFRAVNGSVAAVAVQPDGKILLSGTVTKYNNVAVSSLIRINADGSLDNSFSQMPAGSRFSSLLLLPGGKILVAARGYFGGDTAHIIRLYTDGTLDPSFQPVSGLFNPGIFETFSAAFAMQADGKILVHGNFTQINGIGRNRIARINNTVSPEISLGAVSPLLFCAGSTFNIPFSCAGLSSGTTISVQLSDAIGSFSNPVTIGSIAGESKGLIAATIPVSTVAGSGYRIRLASSSPDMTSADNGVNIQINAAAANSTWNGAFSTDWNDMRNWCGGIPTSTKDVSIPAGTTHEAVVSNNAQVKNLTVASSATLSMNASSYISVYGNLSVSGTFTGAGTISFRGTSVQAVGALTAGGVDINGAGVVLNGNMMVTNILTLTQGHLTLGDFNLSISGSAFGSLASHVVTNGTGAVTNNGKNGIFSFPVGASATSYNPITISDFTPRSFSVRVVNTIAPTIVTPLKAINRTWIITPSSNSINDVGVQFSYTDADGNAQFLPTGTNEVAIHNGSIWNVIPSEFLTFSGTPAMRYVTLLTNKFGPLVLANTGSILAAPVVTAINPVVPGINKAAINPNIVSGDKANLSIQSVTSMKILWQVINSNGYIVSTFSQVIKAGENKVSFATANLAAGVYQVIGTTLKGERVALRFVKQ